MEFESNTNQTVWCRMKEFREKYLQISVEEFSKQTGIDIGRIRKIETGQGKVRLSEMVTVMDVYSLSSEYLLGRVDRPKPIIMDPQTAKEWAAIEQLSMEDLHKLYDMMKKKQGVTTICYGKKRYGIRGKRQKPFSFRQWQVPRETSRTAMPPYIPNCRWAWRYAVMMSEAVKEQILAVRNTALTNMFDVPAVQKIASDMGYYELVLFLEENRNTYVQFILMGKS